MSDIEELISLYKSAVADQVFFEYLHKKQLKQRIKPIDPLDNKRRMRQLKPIGWLTLELGRANLDDNQQRQDKILELVESLKRKRGRPPKDKPMPQAIGRPTKWHEKERNLWLQWLDEVNRSKRFQEWLKANTQRKSDKSKIQYILELLSATDGNRDPQSMATQQLRTYQNMVSKARKLSRKPPK